MRREVADLATRKHTRHIDAIADVADAAEHAATPLRNSIAHILAAADTNAHGAHGGHHRASGGGGGGGVGASGGSGASAMDAAGFRHMAALFSGDATSSALRRYAEDVDRLAADTESITRNLAKLRESYKCVRARVRR